MSSMRRSLLGMLGVVAAATLMFGCQTVRYVEVGGGEELASAPEWVKMNGKSADDRTYFVGISQEQVPSEAEAVNQAYFDALHRVADAVLFRIESVDTLMSGDKSGAQSKWPHNAGPHPRFHGLAGLGAGAFAESGGSGGVFAAPGMIGVVTPARSQYKSRTAQQFELERTSQVLREQVAGMASIVETWTVRERFEPVTRLSDMKYGALWKAKVLVAVPTDMIEERGHAEAERLLAVTEAETQEYRLAAERSEAEQKCAIELTEMRIKQKPAPPVSPSFNFMNNALWHGYYPAGMGGQTVPGVIRTSVKINEE